MPRWIFALILAAPILATPAAFAQEQTAPPATPKPQLNKERPPAKTSDQEVAPPEEDKSMSAPEYSFNPLAAKKAIEVGNFYWKTKHDFRAAQSRFKEATKWNDGDSEAWLRLGEASEKLKDPDAAKQAYTKYLELASDAKNAEEIRKKLKTLK